MIKARQRQHSEDAVRQLLLTYCLFFVCTSATCAEVQAVPPFAARFPKPTPLFVSISGTNDFNDLLKAGVIRNEIEFNEVIFPQTNRILCLREGPGERYSNLFKEKKVDIITLQRVRTVAGLFETLGDPEWRFRPWGTGPS